MGENIYFSRDNVCFCVKRGYNLSSVVITVSIRFSIHKSRGTAFFNNPISQCDCEGHNMAKNEICNQIWDQFHLAMDKCQLDEFSSFFS